MINSIFLLSHSNPILLVLLLTLTIRENILCFNGGPNPERVTNHTEPVFSGGLEYSFVSNYVCERWNKTGKTAARYLREDVRELNFTEKYPNYKDGDAMRFIIHHTHCCVWSFNNCTRTEAHMLFQKYIPGAARFMDNKASFTRYLGVPLMMILPVLHYFQEIYT